MGKYAKKFISLCVVAVMTASLLSACKRGGEDNHKLEPVTTDKIELTYLCWENIELFEKILQDWNKKYPNIKINLKEIELSSYDEQLRALFATDNEPDIFWVNDVAGTIENNMLLDMTRFWELDTESTDIIGGINEFHIGYYDSDYKWYTPVRFFPSAVFINSYMVLNYSSMGMPEKDWTWEEYEIFLETWSRKKYDGKPITALMSDDECMPVKWYPIMADGECKGEYGWKDGSYNMENWTAGLEIQKRWIDSKILVTDDSEEYINLTYGEGASPLKEGFVTARNDWWYNFTRYYDNEKSGGFLENNAVFVPYMEPHLSDVDKRDYRYIGDFDMGAISSRQTKYSREAYEALKFFGWGAEGWKAKLMYLPYMEENAGKNSAYVNGAKMASNFPICLDDEVWEKYTAIYTSGEDKYDRYEYFKDFFNRVKNSRWICSGSKQIPGFDKWLEELENI